MMSFFQPMLPLQRRHLAEMRCDAAEHAELCRLRPSYEGGMAWKYVSGNDYLVRYRQDPVTATKRFVSLGRRSAKTEALHEEFFKGRAGYRSRKADLKPRLALQARVGKALRLARAPRGLVDIARAIAGSRLARHVSVVGDHALYAYECEYHVQFRRELLPTGALDLLVTGASVVDAEEELRNLLRYEGPPSKRRRRFLGIGGADITLNLFDRSTLCDGLEGSGGRAGTIDAALALKPISGMIVDRDGVAITLPVIDPSAYIAVRNAGISVPSACALWGERIAAVTAMRAEGHCAPLSTDCPASHDNMPGWADHQRRDGGSYRPDVLFSALPTNAYE
jgi:Nucleotidyltransferase